METTTPNTIYDPRPRATGHLSARRNLLSRLIMVANELLDRVALGPDIAEGERQGRAYFEALGHIALILDPGAPLTGFGSPSNARMSLAQLQALWAEVVVGEADLGRAEEASRFAHELIARFPGPTAHYVQESAHAFARPQLALNLLAQTSQYITCKEEGALVGRAQRYALDVMLKHKNLPPSAKTPDPDPATTPGGRSAPNHALPKPEATTMIVTASHKNALDRIVEMGELFFDQAVNPTQLALRTAPVVIGPTGAGKSFLAKRAAQQLGSEYFRITRGDWIPRGARPGSRSTTFQILDRLLACDRLTIHCDEIEKWSIDFSKEWSAGIASDLWNTLDRVFPIREFLAETKFEDRTAPTFEEMERKIRTSMWIIGSGAWQSVFEERGRTISFNPNPYNGPPEISAEAIRKSALISPELLLRFNSDIIFLHYPTSKETAAILDSSGITALANELSMPIALGDVNWNQGGIRVLETLATRLVLEKRRRAKRERVAPASETYRTPRLSI